ncbi:uncharacterized protein LOC127122150 [Lathyrus oleraceus]|uniref:uncharacterized protein LOC127122150 n=1 Tax=Pisum sativum TaxID=3888 RepID=UPI0021CF1158|nr:uncharacterized protein LOC127122150 [Pisum sativum]
MEIILGYIDIELALRMERQYSLMEPNTFEQIRDYEKWDRSNRMSLKIIKHDIPEIFQGTISEEITTANNFFAEIEKRFTKSDKVKTSTLHQNLISMKYKGKGNIRKYIMGMSNIVSKFKTLKFELSEDLLIHLVLLYLPSYFGQFKIPYNHQKKKMVS